jgi:PDZ domain-containing secreted protein
MGCTIGQVFYNTPAYNHDLHKYDVVTEVNGETITSCKHFKKILKESDVLKNLKIWVDGDKIEIQSIKLNRENNTFLL